MRERGRKTDKDGERAGAWEGEKVLIGLALKSLHGIQLHRTQKSKLELSIPWINLNPPKLTARNESSH